MKKNFKKYIRIYTKNMPESFRENMQKLGEMHQYAPIGNNMQKYAKNMQKCARNI